MILNLIRDINHKTLFIRLKPCNMFSKCKQGEESNPQSPRHDTRLATRRFDAAAAVGAQRGELHLGMPLRGFVSMAVTVRMRPRRLDRTR